MSYLSAEFQLLDKDKDGLVKIDDLLVALEKAGIHRDDPRLAHLMTAGQKALRRRDSFNEQINFEKFVSLVSESAMLVTRALSGDLEVPGFESFTAEITKLYEETKGYTGGNVADYIPELACADPEAFGVSICTIDGQRFSVGDVDTNFCVQSCSKPISYLLTSQELGSDFVHEYVGCEPSGVKFNEMILKEIDPESNDRGARAIPHNPMVNAGAIMVASLLMYKEKSMSARFKSVVSTWQRLFGGSKPGFNNATYLSEKESAHRNSALAYMMMECKAFPMKTDLRSTLELYFQCCSLEANIDQMAIMASSLANNGVCPLTDDRVFDPNNVRACLSIMSSSGMYDYSGKFNFENGLPAKSGVAGCVFVVVPNRMGIAIFSPRLDGNGNSVRGVEFCRRLCKRFNFHVYESSNAIETAIAASDPSVNAQRTLQECITQALFAAAAGDVYGLRRMVNNGFDLNMADYDDRTPLHVACSNGHLDAAAFIAHWIVSKETTSDTDNKMMNASAGCMLSPLDRWKRTPLDDALSGHHEALAKMLRTLGAHRSASRRGTLLDEISNVGSLCHETSANTDTTATTYAA